MFSSSFFNFEKNVEKHLNYDKRNENIIAFYRDSNKIMFGFAYCKMLCYHRFHAFDPKAILTSWHFSTFMQLTKTDTDAAQCIYTVHVE